MLGPLLRWSVLLTVWQKYKRHLVVAAIVILSWLLVDVLHQDFVEYSQLSQSQHSSWLAWSYVAKWGSDACILALAVIYLKRTAANGSTKLQQAMTAANSKRESKNADTSISPDKPDPFATIRQKKTLRSKADLILEQKKD